MCAVLRSNSAVISWARHQITELLSLHGDAQFLPAEPERAAPGRGSAVGTSPTRRSSLERAQGLASRPFENKPGPRSSDHLPADRGTRAEKTPSQGWLCCCKPADTDQPPFALFSQQRAGAAASPHCPCVSLFGRAVASGAQGGHPVGQGSASASWRERCPQVPAPASHRPTPQLASLRAEHRHRESDLASCKAGRGRVAIRAAALLQTLTWPLSAGCRLALCIGSGSRLIKNRCFQMQAKNHQGSIGSVPVDATSTVHKRSPNSHNEYGAQPSCSQLR